MLCLHQTTGIGKAEPAGIGGLKNLHYALELAERGYVSEESDPYQFRFAILADPRSGRELFHLEHEVRSLTHPMFPRQYRLANRNPEQRMATGYVPGHDAFKRETQRDCGSHGRPAPRDGWVPGIAAVFQAG